MQIDLRRFHAAFFDEAAEHLAVMEESLLALERTPDDGELLNRIFRAAHSVKGASGTFGFTDVAAFTHSLESLLDRMRDREIMPTPVLVELLLKSADVLGALVAAAKDGGPLPPEVEQLVTALDEAGCGGRGGVAATTVKNSDPPESSAGACEYTVKFVPGHDILLYGMDPLLLLRDLARLGKILEVTADTSRLPELTALIPEECHVGWVIRLQTDRSPDEIRAVFVFVEDSSQISIETTSATCAASSAIPNGPQSGDTGSRGADPRAPVSVESQPKMHNVEASSIRVSVEKVDELINLVGELVIAQSMVNQVIGQIPAEILPVMQGALTTMDRSTRDLQERVMSVRMVPLASVFRRLPRVVRDLAGAMGKQINVEITGEDTELDRQMIEQIADPLTHLIRNAVDHGIGTPGERQQAGKPPEGTVGLHAYHEGGNVVIEVTDDGHGLDHERIRRKAVTQGLIGPEDTLSETQIHALIFAPGFSTAEKVTDVSGRGVGMDVVKRNIESLNGSVGIESALGRGSTFRIRLPLTMAILDGLAASLSGDIYIFPLLSVIESLRPQAAEVKTIAGKGEVVMVRGKPVPLVRLHRILHCPGAIADPTRGLVVIVEHQGKRLGILVDDLLGQMQVVMKSIESNYQKVEGLSAATILGDGQVAFVLDVPGLSRLARHEN
ncbi:MAG: chemotaxis protein CheA [Thermoguttaceae bacterium]